VRWEQLDASEQAQKDGLEFRQKLEEGEAELELETSKNRKKRQRGKAAKQKKKNLEAAGINRDVADDDDDAKGRLLDEEEFTSVPAAEPAKQEAEVKESPKDSLKEEEEGPKPPPVATKEEIIPNDGSFLEMMKRQSPKQSEEDDYDRMGFCTTTSRGPLKLPIPRPDKLCTQGNGLHDS
jgi:hypothetical protein